MTKINRQLRLARRPQGLLDDATIEHTTTEPPEPVGGQALVQVELLSIDPTIRTWMDDVQGYLPPIALGEVIRSVGIGEVVERLTLHKATELVLRENGNEWMTARELADAINERGLYAKRDGSLVDPSRSVGTAGRTDDAVAGSRVGLTRAGSTWVHEAFRPPFDGRTGAAAARPDDHGALVAEVGPTTLNAPTAEQCRSRVVGPTSEGEQVKGRAAVARYWCAAGH
jgi:N-terminal domain of oxidoreductase